MRFQVFWGDTEMVNLYARDMARVVTCKESAMIHALLHYTELMPEDVWYGSEVKRIKGALIHDLFMTLIGPDGCSLISSFIKRGLPKKEAIFASLNILYKNSSWMPYISSLIQIENYQPISQLIIQEFLSHKEEIANLASPLLTIVNDEIYPIQFDKEVYIQYPISTEFTICGKIDLLIFQAEKIFVIDLKTGRENNNDKLQVQLYAEMLQNNFPDKEIITQLWYISKENSYRVTIDRLYPILPEILSVITELSEIDSVEYLTKNRGNIG
jgi:hypothetical protein